MKSIPRPKDSIPRLHMSTAAMAIAIMFVAGFVIPKPAKAQSTYKTLHTFTGTDGSEPNGPLIRDGAENIYGTTFAGGTFGAGTVFKVDKFGNEKVLYNFTGGTDGGNPSAGLIRDTAGNFYGTTQVGGAFGFGTVFRLDPVGTEIVLYSFKGGSDGSYPSTFLLRDATGNLYGTTGPDGIGGHGTIFRLNSTGKQTIYTFKGWPRDGEDPNAVIRDAAGNFYGTTVSGGASNVGSLFRVSSAGKETGLYSFIDVPDGATPRGSFILGTSGNLIGATTEGGALNHGTIFQWDKTGNETVLYSFQGGPGDGTSPNGVMVRDPSGNLYSVTSVGGAIGYGTLFKIDSTFSETVLYSFTGGTDGAFPTEGLIRDSAGNLYGTTQNGGSAFGASGNGVVFELTFP